MLFTLPENSLDVVLDRYRSGAKLPAEAWDRGDTKLQATGVLQSLDNQIDVTTGTFEFKARYENRDQSLFPNQFVNVACWPTPSRTSCSYRRRRSSSAPTAPSSTR